MDWLKCILKKERGAEKGCFGQIGDKFLQIGINDYSKELYNETEEKRQVRQVLKVYIDHQQTMYRPPTD